MKSAVLSAFLLMLLLASLAPLQADESAAASSEVHLTALVPEPDELSQPSFTICSTCNKAQGTTVVLFKTEKSTHDYRCINCALIDTDRRGDGIVIAYSARTGEEIRLRKQGDKWQATPKEAVAMILPKKAGDCTDRHLVFSNSEEFASYVAKYEDVAALKPAPIPLNDVKAILKAGRGPLPKQATCPVMKNTFTPTQKTDWTVRNGEMFYFCCGGCKQQFNKS